VQFGISPLLGYSSLAYLTKLPTVYYIGSFLMAVTGLINYIMVC